MVEIRMEIKCSVCREAQEIVVPAQTIEKVVLEVVPCAKCLMTSYDKGYAKCGKDEGN